LYLCVLSHSKAHNRTIYYSSYTDCIRCCHSRDVQTRSILWHAFIDANRRIKIRHES